MMERDDTEWLDALAGRETSASPTRREALALRAALRVTPRDDVVPFTPRDVRRERQLLERAVREGLIDRPPRRAPGWALPLAAGIVVMLTAGILLQLQKTAAPFEVLRGEESGVVRLQAADPAALKQRILHALHGAGIEATGYEALGVHGIDADLPRPLTPAARRVLGQLSLPEPADGVLRIEIRSAE